MLKAGSIGTVVLDGLGEQLYVLKTALQLLQAALASTVSPRLLFVTGWTSQTVVKSAFFGLR